MNDVNAEWVTHGGAGVVVHTHSGPSRGGIYAPAKLIYGLEHGIY